ncbi:MAG: hypothetical protein JST59_04360 [Actinobacteria bacterium]|nr:hypothetical protein [Actinomycetota bacterium]
MSTQRSFGFAGAHAADIEPGDGHPFGDLALLRAVVGESGHRRKPHHDHRDGDDSRSSVDHPRLRR